MRLALLTLDYIRMLVLYIYKCYSLWIAGPIITHKKQSIVCYSWWPKIDLLLCFYTFILPRICWIVAYILWYTIQYTAFSRHNSIQTCSGITACLLTTARILTASVFLTILDCILLLDSGIFLVLRVYKLALRLQMCPSNQCMLKWF